MAAEAAGGTARPAEAASAVGASMAAGGQGPAAATDAISCPVCAHTDAREVWSIDGRSVRECDNCGLGFVWPRIEQDFAAIPETFYYNDWRTLDLEQIEGLYVDVMAAAGRVGTTWAPVAVEKPAIVDAGCGAGHTLPHFRAHGWRVRGVDPWAAVTAIGQKYYRLAIETGKMETADIPPGSQDIVLSVDVLQFVADPKRFIEACLRALRPGGVLYATVPNYESAERQRAGRNWRLLLPQSYLSYFTPASLMQLARSVGFFPVETTPFGGAEGDDYLRLTARRPMETSVTWADLSGDIDDRDLPPLDRANIDETALTPDQLQWRKQGYLVLKNFIPRDLIERYCAVRSDLNQPQGWDYETPYMDVGEIRDLCLYQPLMDMLQHIIGEPVGLHLNLTGWVSTDRDWHQDDYLNPPEVNGHYVAVWFALDKIKPDCGPFQFVPGSHRWPLIRQDRVISLLGLDSSDRTWPSRSERMLTPFVECEIARRGLEVERFLGDKGDVLIWHARLAHRGSHAERPGAERRAIISHYSALTRRSDMPVVRRHPGGGHYFVLTSPNSPTDVFGQSAVRLKRVFTDVMKPRRPAS